LIGLSRRARRIMQENVAFALLTKGLLVSVALTTTLPLWLAVIGDVGVALLVILNALRLAESPGDGRGETKGERDRAKDTGNHPASSTQHPTPNTQYPTPDTRDPDKKAKASRTPQEPAAPDAPLLELVFCSDPSADEQPVPGCVYPAWEPIRVLFTG